MNLGAISAPGSLFDGVAILGSGTVVNAGGIAGGSNGVLEVTGTVINSDVINGGPMGSSPGDGSCLDNKPTGTITRGTVGVSIGTGTVINANLISGGAEGIQAGDVHAAASSPSRRMAPSPRSDPPYPSTAAP